MSPHISPYLPISPHTSGQVVEREKRLLEGMRMMGLTPLANNLGWCLSYF